MLLQKFSPISDAISGAIMAATSVPQLIAYAETVGYAGYLGLSTAGAPLLAWGVATGKFVFFASSLESESLLASSVMTLLTTQHCL
jgi:MFS superfamily sulfate permease-like transporter